VESVLANPTLTDMVHNRGGNVPASSATSLRLADPRVHRGTLWYILILATSSGDYLPHEGGNRLEFFLNNHGG
jgi:hypothetical protein